MPLPFPLAPIVVLAATGRGFYSAQLVDCPGFELYVVDLTPADALRSLAKALDEHPAYQDALRYQLDQQYAANEAQGAVLPVPPSGPPS